MHWRSDVSVAGTVSVWPSPHFVSFAHARSDVFVGAFDFPGSGTAEPTATGLVPRLTNIQRVAGFSTYGATRTIALAAGDNGRNMIATALRPLFAPDCICRWHGLYAMDASTAEQREQYLQQVREIVASKL